MTHPNRKQTLLGWRQEQGGFDWTGWDMQDAIKIAKSGDEEFAQRISWLPPETRVPPRSRFDMGPVEDYVKHVVLEECGVLGNIHAVTKDKHGNLAWVMKGVCPFHRRVHRHQNWIIVEGRPGKDTIIRCMKASKRFTASTHYPYIKIGELALANPECFKHDDRVY